MIERKPTFHGRLVAVSYRFPRRLQTILRSDFLRHGALVFLSTNLANGLGYLFHFFLSRRLGVSGYGELATLLSLSTLASFPATVFSMTVVKASSEARHDAAQLRALGWSVLAIGLSGLLLFPILGLIVARPVSAYLKLGDPGPIVATTFLVASMFAMSGVRAVLQGIERFTPFSLSIGFESILKIALGVGLAFAGFGVSGALWGTALASLITLVFTASSLVPYLRANEGTATIDLARIVRSLGAVSCAMLALTLLGSADIIVVKHYFTSHVAGLYSIVALAGRMLLFLVGFIPLIVMPKATAHIITGTSPMRVLRQAVYALALCSAGALAVFALGPEQVIRALAGHAFVAAAMFLVPYGVAMVALSLTTTLVYYRLSIHRFGFILPLLTVAAGTVAAMIAYHHTIAQVISALIGGEVSAALVCLIGIAPIAKPAQTVKIIRGPQSVSGKEVWESH